MNFSKRQLIGLGGCALLFIGVFLPIVSVPIMGGLNYFQNGRGDGTIVLILAVLSAVFFLQKKYLPVLFTGVGILAMLLFTFLGFYFRMGQMRAELERDLAGNPFAGLGQLAIQSVQMQWGWAVLVLGALVVMAAATWESEDVKRFGMPKVAAIVAVVLVGVAGLAYGTNHQSSKVSAGSHKARADAQSTTPATTGVKTESPNDAEAKTYLPKVKLYQAWGGYSYGRMTCMEFEGRKCAAFRAKVKNEGDRPLQRVEVTVYFPDKDGNVVFEKRYSPVLANSGGYGSILGGNNDPLKPGYIREFGYVVDDCPTECVPKDVRIAVTNVSFVEPHGE